MVQADLQLLRFLRISNVWLLTDAFGRRFLIDSGDRVERAALMAGLWRLGIRTKGDLTAVLLTHRHRDHAGNAAWLRRRFAAPIACHRDDAPLLEGIKPPQRLFPRPAPLIHKFMCVFEDMQPAVCPVDEPFSAGIWKWDFEVIPTPGHTEGTVMLFHAPTRTLFSGDSILAGIPPLRLFNHLSLAKAEYSLDVEACRQSVRDFLATGPIIDRICPGHGPMVMRNLALRLAMLSGKEHFFTP